MCMYVYIIYRGRQIASEVNSKQQQKQKKNQKSG